MVESGVWARALRFSNFTSSKQGSKVCLAKMIESNDESKPSSLMLSPRLASGEVSECGDGAWGWGAAWLQGEPQGPGTS